MSDNYDTQLPPGFEDAPAAVRRSYIKRQQAAAKRSATSSASTSSASSSFPILAILFDILFYMTIAGIGYTLMFSELPPIIVTILISTNIPALLTYYALSKLCRSQY